MKSNLLKNLILKILTQPTAPFRETWVSASIQEIAETFDLPFFEDLYGNLWLNAENLKDLKSKSLVIVAHMDHPGMVITKFYQKSKKYYAEAKWLGGGPLNIKGHAVKVFAHEESLAVFNGKIISHTNLGKRGPDKVIIEINTELAASQLMREAVEKYGPHAGIASKIITPKGFKMYGPWGACLWFDQASQGVAINGNQVITKAADDLIGVCAMMNALIEMKKIANLNNIAMLISTAEESGFHGSMYALRSKALNPKTTAIISIETSSRLPGALPGEGPVIRLGDKATIFDPAFTYWIEKQAKIIAKKQKTFKYQKRVMDGGTCEATAFNAFGFKVAGLSTPLVNYHNQYLPTELLNNTGRKKPSATVLNGAHPEQVNFNDVVGLSEFIKLILLHFNDSTFKNLNDEAFAEFRKTLLDHNKKETKQYFY